MSFLPLDKYTVLAYNIVMMRKKRNDRNYVIYQVTASTGDAYIGLTVSRGRAFVRSVKIRWQKHVSRAKCEKKNWNFCQFLRKNDDVEFTYEILEVVRGRKPAYSRERELIAEIQPTLNTF